MEYVRESLQLSRFVVEVEEVGFVDWCLVLGFLFLKILMVRNIPFSCLSCFFSSGSNSDVLFKRFCNVETDDRDYFVGEYLTLIHIFFQVSEYILASTAFLAFGGYGNYTLRRYTHYCTRTLHVYTEIHVHVYMLCKLCGTYLTDDMSYASIYMLPNDQCLKDWSIMQTIGKV